MFSKRLFCLIYILLFSFSFSLYAAAINFEKEERGKEAEKEEEELLLLQADNVEYDEKNKIIMAKGHVKLRYAERTMLADEVYYYEKTELFKARGNVTLIEKEDEIAFFSDEIELNKAFSKGYFKPLKARMGEYARIVSQGGKVLDAEKVAFYKSSYTPCKLCEADPSRPPLWQLNSEETIEDHEANMLIHKHSWLEFFGKPFLYIPYYTHPDPTIFQKTGFLMPSYTRTHYLGSAVNIPFYWGIDPSYDLTLYYLQTEKQQGLINAKWRHQLDHGYYEMDGAFTRSDYIETLPNQSQKKKEKKNRYHLFGKGLFELNDYFRWGFSLNEISDDLYLDDYNFSHPEGLFNHKSILTNEVFLEGFEERDYLSIRLYDFDDLRSKNERARPPRILPFAELSALGDPASFLGGRFSFNGNFVALTRDKDKTNRDDQDYKRFIGDLGWQRHFITSLGLFSSFETHAIGRYYKLNHYRGPRASTTTIPGHNKEFSDLSAQVSYKLSYPFYKNYAHFDHIIEPVAAFIYNSYKRGERRFPNEDSVDLELDSANLFALNMHPGYDRIDQGPRAIYALSTAFYGHKQGSLEAFIGQTKRFKQRQTSQKGTGLHNKSSDIIGNIIARPHPFLQASYHFRHDSQNFARRYYRFDADIGPAYFRPGITYLFVDQPLEASINDSKRERTLRFSSQFTDYWSFSARNIKNLGPRKNNDRGSRISAATLTYEDECFIFEMNIEHDHHKRGRQNPETEFYARLVFKTLGGILTPRYKRSKNSNAKRSSSF